MKPKIVGTALLFASNGALFASLLPWYPSLMRTWGLSESAFGFIVACFAFGSIVSSAAPAPIVRRFGPLRTVAVGTVVMAAVLSVGGFVLGGGLALAALLLFLGFVDPIVDVAQNVVAVRVQDEAGFSIMSSVHASWSLGAAAGGAAATTAVGHVSMSWYLVGAALVATALAWLGCTLVSEVPAAEENTETHSQPGLHVAWLVLPIVVVAISGTAVEEIANSWAALMAADLTHVPVSEAGGALTVMLAAQCVGRFLGDPMINRWGRTHVAQFGGVLIATGAILAMLSHSAPILFLGLGAAGFGCATIVPSAFTAASRLPGLSEGAGLTMVSWLMRIGFLATSPIIGLVASSTSLRVALGILVLGGVTIITLAGRLDPSPPAQVVKIDR